MVLPSGKQIRRWNTATLVGIRVTRYPIFRSKIRILSELVSPISTIFASVRKQKSALIVNSVPILSKLFFFWLCRNKFGPNSVRIRFSCLSKNEICPWYDCKNRLIKIRWIFAGNKKTSFLSLEELRELDSRSFDMEMCWSTRDWLKNKFYLCFTRCSIWR